MNFISLLTNRYILILLVLFIGGGIVISLVTSLLKKGGNVAVSASKGGISTLFSCIVVALGFFKDVIVILYLFLCLIFEYFTKKR